MPAIMNKNKFIAQFHFYVHSLTATFWIGDGCVMLLFSWLCSVIYFATDIETLFSCTFLTKYIHFAIVYSRLWSSQLVYQRLLWIPGACIIFRFENIADIV